jgi:prolyl-tRNA synthetase
VDVMLDDRNERPGAMFADWELIGVPHRVTIGDRGLKDGRWSTSTAAMPRSKVRGRTLKWQLQSRLAA